MMNIDKVIDMISSEEIKNKVRDTLDMLPKYWWHVAASSSGKYHPAFALGEGGLVRHSLVCVHFANRNAMAWNFTDRERDILLWAALVHDGLKQGNGEEGHTVHEHPILMAQALRTWFSGDADAELAAHMIESHMGKWTTSQYSSVVLPEPEDKFQLALSAADMAAADKELVMAPGFFG